MDRSQGGLGIGLTLVRSLVDLHGGEDMAESPGLGQGSEFTVRLPVLSPERVPKSQSKVDRTNTPRRRILIVEDNVDSGRTLTRLLELWGHEVCYTTDGREGLAAADFRPDIVLLEIGLPDLDGYEIAERLRNNPITSAAVLIALTGYGQIEDRRRALQKGFDHHVVKPVDADQLAALLAADHRA